MCGVRDCCPSQERVQQAMLRAKTITGRKKAGKWPFSVIHCHGLLFHSLVHGRRKWVLAISLASFLWAWGRPQALPLVTFAVHTHLWMFAKELFQPDCWEERLSDFVITKSLNLSDSLKATTCICVLVWKNLSLVWGIFLLQEDRCWTLGWPRGLFAVHCGRRVSHTPEWYIEVARFLFLSTCFALQEQ